MGSSSAGGGKGNRLESFCPRFGFQIRQLPFAPLLLVLRGAAIHPGFPAGEQSADQQCQIRTSLASGHRSPILDFGVLNAKSRVPLAAGKIIHSVGNNVGVKQRLGPRQIFVP